MKSLALLSITILITAFLVLPASAASSGVDGVETWNPQVVDYIYVNDTVDETVYYWIITNDTMDNYNWTVNGTNFTGSVVDKNHSFNITWDNMSIDTVNTVIFTGRNDSGSEVEFRWYVNVYNISSENNNNIFDAIESALEKHVTDVKIRMFKYKIAKNGNTLKGTAEKVNALHNEIAKRQMAREALRMELKNGTITHENYTIAMKQLQINAKYNMDLLSSLVGSGNTAAEALDVDAEVNGNGKGKGNQKVQKIPDE